MDNSLKASRFALGRSGVQISSSAPLSILSGEFLLVLSLFRCHIVVFESYLSVKLRYQFLACTNWVIAYSLRIYYTFSSKQSGSYRIFTSLMLVSVDDYGSDILEFSLNLL